MLLLILAVLWGIVLIPPALQSRSERHRLRSVDVFRRRLEKLAPPVTAAAAAARPPGAARPVGAARSHVAVVASPALVLPIRPAAPAPDPAIPPVPAFCSRAALLHRRRVVLGGLLAGTVVTLIGAVVTGAAALLVVHAAAGFGVAAYLSGLRRLRRLALERAAKVRYLPVSGGRQEEQAAAAVVRTGTGEVVIGEDRLPHSASR